MPIPDASDGPVTPDGTVFALFKQLHRQLRDQLSDLDDEAVQWVPERLDGSASLPTLPTDERRPGMTWLIGNYGHAREHVGQVQLTRQLFLAERGSRRP